MGPKGVPDTKTDRPTDRQLRQVQSRVYSESPRERSCRVGETEQQATRQLESNLRFLKLEDKRKKPQVGTSLRR
jgi:hypothetical protein